MVSFKCFVVLFWEFLIFMFRNGFGGRVMVLLFIFMVVLVDWRYFSLVLFSGVLLCGGFVGILISILVFDSCFSVFRMLL